MTYMDYSLRVNLTTPNRNHQNLRQPNKTKKSTKPLVNVFERLAASTFSCSFHLLSPSSSRQVFSHVVVSRVCPSSDILRSLDLLDPRGVLREPSVEVSAKLQHHIRVTSSICWLCKKELPSPSPLCEMSC